MIVIATFWIIAGWLCGWMLLLSMRLLKPPERYPVQIGQQSGMGKDYMLTLPAMSVVIPARNAPDKIGALLSSLAKQTLRPAEMIVVVDAAEDETAIIAAASGASVVTAGESPEGWADKSWACWRGAHAAKGEVLVFLDADTVLEADGLERLGLAFQEKGGFLSVQPYHWMKRAYERLSAFFNLIVVFSVGSGQEGGAFGPCVVCGREMYMDAGGHQAVSGEALENYHLGIVFKRQGMQVSNRLGRGLIASRMFPDGLTGLIGGSRNSFSGGIFATSPIKLMAISIWIAGAVSAVTQWLAIGADPSGPAVLAGALFYLAYAIQIVMMLRYAGNFSFAGLLFPLPLLVFLLAFILLVYRTFARGRGNWKGSRSGPAGQAE
ncbi:glycosyltransferase [Paenibacillus sp. GCM10012307]|uniref:4,4'-diaponeurosporenoate glycosyltransferase n=1 Tax=Paenibacillus roseus TaxID=2798579 RepID=A0A934MX16_9BACL|nr:glycosyltransferase family 2 protein [Paenibacillus roseus]MBJ6363717.1 glycosyltransferase family 2 protein [Paenibacillus roseus]